MALAGSNRVTGVAFDECLEAHYSLWNKDYTEHPLRTKVCIERCEKLKLLSRCKRIPVREATLSEIQACHTKRHYDLLHSTQWMDQKNLQEISQQYDYSYFHQNSFENANLALGATIDLVTDIVTEKIHNGMAIVRPPGHHAMREEFSGYCYYNNVAVAAQLMMDQHGLDRIVILDWDVHHGQGSQFLFYDDPRVLYVSIHRYEFGEEWPCLRESDYDFIGEGAGKGYNINLPLNEIGCGNDEFLSMFFHVLLPVFQEFDPQLVLVSAGYDCAIGCPEGEMCVTPACFAHFINLLSPLASGKIALLLEGGYNLKSLAESVALSLRALVGDPVPSISPISTPKLSVIESVLCAVKCLHPYWNSLCYVDVTERENISLLSYPYPSVLQNPPKEGMNFYTEDSRPKLFPLLQECVGDEVMATMEEVNRRIDTLIQTTSLACPPHRLTLCHTSSLASSQLCYCLCRHFQDSDWWKRCILFNTPADASQMSEFCIQKSIDVVVDRKSEASLVISDNDRAKSEGCDGIVHDSFITSAVKYAKNSRGVKRMVVLHMLDGTSADALTDVPSGVLQVTLALPGYGENKGKQSQESKSDHEAGAGDNIWIPLATDPVTDADILAVFHLIVLPVLYEFCPDFVLFSWSASTRVSLEVMGAVCRYLHGVAQGKMLVVVNKSPSSLSSLPGNGDVSPGNPDSVCPEQEVSLVSHCASVLLGGQCLRLSSHELSQKATDVIKETLDGLKNKWKSLVYRVHIPKQNATDKRHRKDRGKDVNL